MTNRERAVFKALVAWADRCTPEDAFTAKEWAEFDIVIQQSKLILAGCTCDAGGSAGCPVHDAAVRNDDDPDAPLKEHGGQTDV